MSGHDARAVRARDGWQRWSAQCPCGWTRQAFGKEDAERAATIHRSVMRALSIVETEVICECYDPMTMEYAGEGPCPRCRIREHLRDAS